MLRRLLNFFRPRRLEDDIREEIEFHRSRTSGSFGNPTLIQDRVRDASTLAWLETVAQDVRYGLRQLGKAPVLLIVAVLSLALGIGANTAIFTMIDAVMLRSLPVHDPGALVLFYDGMFQGADSGNGFPGDAFSYPLWKYFQAHGDSFSGLCAFRRGSDTVVLHVAGTIGDGTPEWAKVHLVSGNYFSVLGVNAVVGRVLENNDDKLTAPAAAVISYRFWGRRFHFDAAIAGKTVVLNGTAFTVVGVAAKEFFGERVQTSPDFWIPLAWQPQITQREPWRDAHDYYWLNMMGRLNPGVSIRSAEAARNVQLRQFYLEEAGAHPSAPVRQKIENWHVDLKPGGAGISGLRHLYSSPLHVLMAVSAAVLLIACANIAILLLARASARRKEFLTRLSLGASRARLLRQMLTESILLAVIGGAAGAGFAWWSVRLLAVIMNADPVVNVRPDVPVLVFTLSVSVLTGVLFGILPAMTCSRMDLREGTGKRRFGSAHSLIVGQVALSLVLLLGAGLLAHSLIAIEGQDFGFRPDNVLLIRTDPKLAGYQPKELFPLYREIYERFNQIPGVLSTGISRGTPESGSISSGDFSILGYAPAAGQDMKLNCVEVGPRYFETLGIPLRLGRFIGPEDTPASTPVAVVNESFVRLFFPKENPIGRRIGLGAPFKEPGLEIAGVAADSKYYDLREKAKPMIFVSVWQGQGYSLYAGDLLLRTLPEASSGVATEARRVLKSISSKLPFSGVTTLKHQVDDSLRTQRLFTSLCVLFGVVALALAAIGIYATMAYAVARRTAEIGIRMAIGAQRSDVLWMVLRDVVVLLAIGIGIGLPVALGCTRWIRGFLFGVQASDPFSIAGAVLLILALALMAGYLPARRAARIDPMVALRHE